MFIKFLRLLCAFSFLSVMVIPCSFADEPSRDSEIAGLKAQLQQLMQRIEKLEVEQTVSKEESKKAKEEVTKLKETSQAAQAGRVDLANTL